jgi:hypothetical protein
MNTTSFSLTSYTLAAMVTTRTMKKAALAFSTEHFTVNSEAA